MAERLLPSETRLRNRRIGMILIGIFVAMFVGSVIFVMAQH
ncbi:MAG: hypothetical protein ACREJ4_13270 [Candidatus Methylomirabilaceae bacterium]